VRIAEDMSKNDDTAQNVSSRRFLDCVQFWTLLMGESPFTSHDSDVASSAVGSSFFDSVWTRVSPMKEKEKTLHFQHGASTQNLSRQQQPQRQGQQTVPIIPCGMVVPVEPWDASTSPKVRLFFPCDFSVLLCILNHVLCSPSDMFCSSV
jgi:hypothetical protein